MKLLKKLLRRFRFVELLGETVFPTKRISYSSYGEDLIVSGILKRFEFKTGTKLKFSYMDIGAWKPRTGSNTYIFYKNGIFGTAIEPNPYLRRMWELLRPKDQFLSVACSNQSSVNLILFDRSAPSNTVDLNFASYIAMRQNRAVTNLIEVQGRTLHELIREHKQKFEGDFILDLDIEGLDEDVLTSYDFNTNPRPMIILVEDVPTPSDTESQSSKINELLSGVDYYLVGGSVITSIYIDLRHPISTVVYY